MDRPAITPATIVVAPGKSLSMVAHNRFDRKRERLRRDFSRQKLAEVLAELLTDMGFRCE